MAHIFIAKQPIDAKLTPNQTICTYAHLLLTSLHYYRNE